MIIKSIGGHSSSKRSNIKGLIDYVYDHSKIKDQNGNICVSKHYLRSFDTEKWIDQFIINDSKKTFNYSKRNVLRHEVISFSRDSTPFLLKNREVLKAIQKEYLKHRNSPGIAVVHYEEGKHIHIHCVIAGVNIDGSSNRLSKTAFKNFKLEMEEFQKQWTELYHSEIDHDQRKKKE